MFVYFYIKLWRHSNKNVLRYFTTSSCVCISIYTYTSMLIHNFFLFIRVVPLNFSSVLVNLLFAWTALQIRILITKIIRRVTRCSTKNAFCAIDDRNEKNVVINLSEIFFDWVTYLLFGFAGMTSDSVHSILSNNMCTSNTTMR